MSDQSSSSDAPKASGPSTSAVKPSSSSKTNVFLSLAPTVVGPSRLVVPDAGVTVTTDEAEFSPQAADAVRKAVAEAQGRGDTIELIEKEA